MAEDDRNPIEVAYERSNPDLDPQLVWRGKDEQNWSDLVVQAPPLFIQEKSASEGADRRRSQNQRLRKPVGSKPLRVLWPA